MRNLSLSGEPVSLNMPSGKMLVFDILLNEELKMNTDLFTNINDAKLIDIQTSLFPHSGNGILGLYYTKSNCNEININISEIVKIDFNKITRPSRRTFSTDAAVLVLIDIDKLKGFCSIFDYDDFVDTITSLESCNNYIKKINKKIENTFAIISTPGIGKGFDFEGSGRYEIMNECFN